MGNSIEIAISGATGFVGRALVARCAEKGWGVRALVRNTSEAVLANVRYCTVGDLSEEVDLRSVIAGVDVLVHAAARVHVMIDTAGDPSAAFRLVNTTGTLRLARQAAQAGVKRFVFISSVKVNGESTRVAEPFQETDTPHPVDPYGVSKCEAEAGLRSLARETGMEVVIIRPPLVYGPGVKANFASLMRAVQRGWPLPLGAIQNRRSMVALDNLVDFIITCTTHPRAANETFLVSDGQDLSTTELVRSLATACQRPARLVPLPLQVLTVLGRLCGRQGAVERLGGNLQVDITKARTLLGWAPPVAVKEGLRRAFLGQAKT
jgi:nucleoside-diphosphate-sugar epimerase